MAQGNQQAKAAAAKAAEDAEANRIAEERKRRETDTNYNPLLQNNITNRDIFRTLIFHFGTDNYVPIVGTNPKYGIALFVKKLLARPINSDDDAAAEQRFYDSLVNNLRGYAMEGHNDRIEEDKFCELMRTFNTTNAYEYSDEQQYDQFLERLFYRIQHKNTQEVAIADFKGLIERSGFEFADGEFENLVRWYFRGKENITMEEFKLFATGNCIKQVDKKK